MIKKIILNPYYSGISFILYLIIIGSLVFRTQDYPHKINFVPLKNYSNALKYWMNGHGNIWAILDIPLNVLIFIPIGILMTFWFQSLKNKTSLISIVSLSFSISLFIEIIQIFLPTRAADIDDLIFNTLGAAIGYFIAEQKWLKKYL